MTDLNAHFEQSYAFIIGIDKYESVRQLQTAVNDAKALEAAFQSQGFTVANILLDEAATKENILQLIQASIPERLGEKNRLIFYFAGHGVAFESEGDPQGFLVPVDANLDEVDSLLPMGELIQAMNTWPCRHGLLIMDCCFAGSLRWSLGTRNFRRRGKRVIYQERFTHYIKDPAWQVLVSAGADQEAVDVMNGLLGVRTGELHSPFATALLEGLSGRADFGVVEGKQDGLVTATELYIYLRDRVNQMTVNSSVRQTPAIFDLARHDKGEFLFLNPNSPLNLPPFPERNPYIGLRSYTAEDRLYYYGRDQVVDDLLDKCQKEPLVIVTGGSGVGKSSLLAASLVPRLEEMGWEVLPVFTPGRDPLSKLESEIPDWKEQLSSGNKVWIIDQYEECLTAGLSSPLWQDFEREVAEFIENEESNRKDGIPASLLIVIAVRSDYALLLQTQTHPLNPTGGHWWKEGRFLVPYFSREDLLEVIIRPADQAVLFFEPASFPFTLANELDGLPGALPLLSLSLSTLYDRFVASNRKDRTLLASEYWSMGGIAGILSNRADSVTDQLADLQPVLKKILVRMIQVENGQLTGRRVAYLPAELNTNDNRKWVDELDYPGEKAKEEVEKVVQTLLDEQLIVLTSDQQGQSYLEPVHDALILFWPRCRKWIEEERIGRLIIHRNLWEVVKEYSTTIPSSIRDRRPSTVPTPTLLWDNNPHLSNLYGELSNEDHSFNQLEKNFLERSMEQRENEIERLEHLNEQITQQRDEALRQKEEAERRGREIQSLAHAQVASTEIGKDNGLAYYLAHASFQVLQKATPSPFPTKTLLQIAYQHQPFWPIQIFSESVRRMAISHPSDLLVLLGNDKHIIVLDRDGQELAKSHKAYLSLWGVHLDPRERFAVLQLEEKEYELWNFRLGETWPLASGTQPIWSGDGHFCVLWNPAEATAWYKTGETFDQWEWIWSKEGLEQVTVCANNRVLLQRGPDLAQLLTEDGSLLNHWDQAKVGLTSKDGNQFILFTEGHLVLFQTAGGAELSRLPLETGEEMAEVGLSPDGRLIFTQNKEARISLWGLDSEKRWQLRLEVPAGYHPAFSDNSHYFLTNHIDGTKVWDAKHDFTLIWEDKLELGSRGSVSLNGLELILMRRINSRQADVAPMNLPLFSPNSRYLVLNNAPVRFKLIDLFTEKQFEFPKLEVSSFSFFSAGSNFLYLESSWTHIHRWALRGSIPVQVGGAKANFQQIDFVRNRTLISGVHSNHVIGFYHMDGTPIWEERLPERVSWRIRFSPDGRFVMAFNQAEAKCWQLQDHQVKLLDFSTTEMADVVFSKDSRHFIQLNSAGHGVLWQWENESWQVRANSFKDMKKPRFSPTGEMIYSIVSQVAIQLWNLDGEMLDELRFYGAQGTEPIEWISTGNSLRDYQLVEFFNEDKFAVTKSKYGSLRFWKLKKSYQQTDNGPARLQQIESILLDLSIHEGIHTKFKLSPDRKNLLLYTASGSRFQRIPLDVFYKEEVVTSVPSPGFISYKDLKASSGFSPQGDLQYELYENYELRLQKLGELQDTLINIYPNLESTSLFDRSDVVYVDYSWLEYFSTHWIKISPDNKFMFVQLGKNQGASLWDLEGNKLIDLEEKGSSITAAIFSSDSQHLLTVTKDGIATLYPLPEKIIETLSAPDYLPELTPRQKEKAGLS